MHTETGQIVDWEALQKLSEEQQAKHVPVVRNLTEHEKFIRYVALYSPCVCGSGKKFKFCCHKKPNS